MGGYTRLLPTEDRYLYSKSQFQETLAFSLGGHAAEQLIFGEVTTGRVKRHRARHRAWRGRW